VSPTSVIDLANRPEVAIVGTGVAGLGCLWNLRDRIRPVLLEKNGYIGGHTNTRWVEEDGKKLPIDTGFIVFNYQTYPHLTALFAELEIPVKRAEMSFAVRHDPDGLEYNGMGPTKLFAQRRNLLRPDFYRLLHDIFRFFKVARALLDDESATACTVREFTARHGLGREFLEWYLVPMGSAVWSTEPTAMLDFPARTLFRFFHNHGFLGVTTHHPWFTVDGGSRCYVEKILQKTRPEVVYGGVLSIREESDRVWVEFVSGETRAFDRVILATHADEALALLDSPTPQQRELLSPFHYQKNHAALHRNPCFLPQRRRAWASWNFLVQAGEPGTPPMATTHYWMNALQGVSENHDYFVSLNRRSALRDEEILYETEYTHPVFSLGTMSAQPHLPKLNQTSPTQRIFFCGSYFRYGFHEDAYGSAVDLCRLPAWQMENLPSPRQPAS
jgi:uncharacterized protein